LAGIFKRHQDFTRQIGELKCLRPGDFQNGVGRREDWIPFRRPQDLELFADGLRKAGLPD
jgi:hypothetical protein